MPNPLTEIARELQDCQKKVQLIYAFNGVGKTRLSREFKDLIDSQDSEEGDTDFINARVLYYNAFTEDLFYWNNSREDVKLNISPNNFTDWILRTQGQDANITRRFQHYTTSILTPRFHPLLTSISFSLERGDDTPVENIKISKGEESNLIWCVFYCLISEVVEILNIPEPEERGEQTFENLQYVFIDDPVSSLDDNHLIELAVDIANLIKDSESELKFIITTHNPLFYNVLYNELNIRSQNYRPRECEKYRLEKNESGTYTLTPQTNDSPFSYHLHLMKELQIAIESGNIHKYHFSFLRNILEKTSTFLGHEKWVDLLPEETDGARDRYFSRIINLSSHSNHSGEETIAVNDNDKRVLEHLFRQIQERYHFDLSNN
ncbi:AAA family ATPase [Persicobacter diffluens]|uniref:Anticodon nuclease n=1 Tax=Persicobacter diffluens TaxID=981 RepID=A0AAN5AN25_9BACT|nr:anticodon nuclease [Persicobacter diffluens]